MELTIAAVKARREVLEADYRKVLDTANALDGAMQDCDYWIGQIEADDASKAEVKETDGDQH